MSTAAQVSSGGRDFLNSVVARIERLPPSRWHLKARLIVGIATFFDGLDVLAIAYVLPVIVPLWHLKPAEIGFLISAGFFGQLIGALTFGWVAERYGRITAMTISILLYAIMSLACSFAWSYTSLFVLRAVQGIGLGGELPVAATYISEISPAKGRGRSLLYYQLVFPFGLAACAIIALYVVPNLGWRYLFAIGALPALLVMLLRSMLPESPRWLAVRGKRDEAEAAMSRIEKGIQESIQAPLPAPYRVVASEARKASWSDMFGPLYRKRTIIIWLIWFATSLANFGLVAWLPAVYRTTFNLGVDASLQYNLVTTLVGLAGCVFAALIIDAVPRGRLFTIAFLLNACAMLALWYFGPTTPQIVMVLVSFGYFFVSITSLSVWAYTPELYPTRSRAVNVSAASAWGRIATIVGPSLIGLTLAQLGLASVFLAIGLLTLITAIAVMILSVDTKDKVLEEVSP